MDVYDQYGDDMEDVFYDDNMEGEGGLDPFANLDQFLA
jgi:hypothetical protein